MLLGVLVVPVGGVAASRRALRELLLPGQRRVHTSDESRARRYQLLGAVGRLEATAVVYDLRRPSGVNRVEARRRLLVAAARDLVARQVVTWTLDAQHDHQAAVDRVTIDLAFRGVVDAPAYDHRPASSEPLLWAIDAVVWAWGAGGDWRRRVAHLVEQRPVEV